MAKHEKQKRSQNKPIDFSSRLDQLMTQLENAVMEAIAKLKEKI